MASRTIGALIALMFALQGAGSTAPAVREQTGTFALYGAVQRSQSRLRRIGKNALDLVQIAGGKPIVRYEPVAGARVHFLLIRDDFRTYTHLHPSVEHNGHFMVRVALDANHRYYAFVDSFPQGIGEQAFRFTLQSGSPPHHADTTLATPSTAGFAGPYKIVLSTARFRAGTPVTLSASVTRNGRIVTPKAGQSFQTVASLVNTGSLRYAAMYEGASMGMRYPGEYDHPQVRLPALPRGTYRMWLQLTINNVHFTAPFTLVAQ